MLFEMPWQAWLILLFMVVPATMLWVLTMRDVENHAGTRFYRRPPVVYKKSVDGMTVTVTTLADYLSAGEKSIGSSIIRCPETFMVFSDLPEMKPYRSGSLADLGELLGQYVHLQCLDLICPGTEFFLDQNHKLRNAYYFEMPKGFDDCFKAMYGYRHDSLYGKLIAWIEYQPEAWVFVTGFGLVAVGIGTFLLGTWLLQAVGWLMTHSLLTIILRWLLG